MRQEIIFIKLGGSVITDKEASMVVRQRVLKRLIAEVARAKKETSALYVLGHGQGGFAHVPALRYQTMAGFINQASLQGMAITQDSAAKLNRVVVSACLAQNLPAVSFAMSNTLVTQQRQKQHWTGHVLEEYLQKGLLPVTYGDVIVDSQQGCTIWSTETIFNFLIAWLIEKGEYQVKKVIHVNGVAGVLDGQGELIPTISLADLPQIKKIITQTKGYDVTGGMWHKLAESVKLIKHGIETDILSGLKKDNLYQALVGKKWVGTKVVAK